MCAVLLIFNAAISGKLIGLLAMLAAALTIALPCQAAEAAMGSPGLS
jgi:hypothetical protein